jgi:uncharacterized cofD-like protein
VHITAIVTVADDGGSSGRLREEMDMPAARRHSQRVDCFGDTEPLMEKVMQYRFSTGTGLAGHNLGNLLLAAMNEITGDFVTAVKTLSGVLAVRGDVLPASTQSIQLKAEMTDGSIVDRENPKYRLQARDQAGCFLEPADAVPLSEALVGDCRSGCDFDRAGQSCTRAFCPTCWCAACLMPSKRSQAPKMYICNVMTQPG